LPWVESQRSDEDFSLLTAEAKPTAVSKSVADELTDEHLYFAKECKDCIYKSDQCGCQPTVEYFACVTKHCEPAKTPAFADKCSARKNKCGSELDIECLGEKTFCKSKFNQLPTGGLGLTVDVNEDDAFCGPFGKCLGHLRMSAKVVRRANKESAPKVSLPKVINFVAGPAPAVAGAPAAGPGPAPAPTFAVSTPAAPKAPPAPPVWFECGLPKVDKPDINKKADWTTSQVEAKDDKAHVKLSLPKTWIKAAEGRKVYCLLKDKDGKRLTQPAWTAVTNVHEKVEVEKEDEEEEEEEEKDEKKEEKKEAKKEDKKEEKAPKEEVKKEEKEDEFGKPPWMTDKANAKLAAKKVEKVEKKAEKKEEKKEKKIEKKVEKEEKKIEKKVIKVEKKEEEVEKKEEKAAAKQVKKAEFGQPPWMADKEAKEAKDAAHAKKKSSIIEAKAAEENKKREADKKAKKDAANEKLKVDNNSGLPWMKGKANAPAFGA